jgi:hypothetical protein
VTNVSYQIVVIFNKISNITNKEKTGLLEMVVKEHCRYTQLIEISPLRRFLDLTGTLSGRYD